MARRVFDLVDVRKSRPGAERYRLSIRRFRVTAGETLALVGPSGCGKSTALDLLAFALRPDQPDAAGRFLFSPTADRVIDIHDAWRRGGLNAMAADRMRHMGYVLQTGGLLPFLTAGDNVTLACKMLGIVPRRLEAIKETAERLGILPLLSKYPAQLSVGERQRVAIAKALAHDPAVVLADEPTAALDPANSRLVMKLFLDLARSQGSTIVMVSHDQDLAGELGFTLVPMTVTPSDGGVEAELVHNASSGSRPKQPRPSGPASFSDPFLQSGWAPAGGSSYGTAASLSGQVVAGREEGWR